MVKKHVLILRPVDSWFFRDGRPMHMGEGVTRAVRSVFPPYAPTVVGAVRAALARKMGWDGKGGKTNPSWPKGIGSGQDLGGLRFSGPLLLQDKKPVFPMPLHLLGKVNETSGVWEPRTFLRPGQAVDCDLGNVKLPAIATGEKSQGLKNGIGYYLTQDGFAAALRGELPKARDVVPTSKLWSAEQRIGIRREETTRTTGDGALFSTVHVRLEVNVELAVVVEAEGVAWPEGFPGQGTMLPFGGEGRLADMTEGARLDLPCGCSTDGKAVLVLLTPADMGAWNPAPGAEIPGATGWTLTCACIEKSFRLGGWDSLAFAPLPLRSMLPAGSVLFCEGNGELPRSIGEQNHYGFGHVAVGAWKA